MGCSQPKPSRNQVYKGSFNNEFDRKGGTLPTEPVSRQDTLVLVPTSRNQHIKKDFYSIDSKPQQKTKLSSQQPLKNVNAKVYQFRKINDLSDFPLWKYVLDFLEFKDLMKMAATSKRLFAQCSNDELLEKFSAKDDDSFHNYDEDGEDEYDEQF